MQLPKPKNNNMAVLADLINRGETDCLRFSWMEGFRTRISNLKLQHRLPLVYKTKWKVNRFGHQFKYRVHILPPAKRDYAIGLYKKMAKSA